MSLRERKDCTDEALVPKASAIHSSVLPASTHSRICVMCGLRAMRFFESVILPPTPYLLLPGSVPRMVWIRLAMNSWPFLYILPPQRVLKASIHAANTFELPTGRTEGYEPSSCVPGALSGGSFSGG